MSFRPESRNICVVAALDKGVTVQALAEPQTRLFSPILHYFSTFVQQQPAYIYAHLVFIVLAGILWPLQVSQKNCSPL